MSNTTKKKIRIQIYNKEDIISLRKKLLLTQEDFSQGLGYYSGNYIAKIEGGFIPLSMEFQLKCKEYAKKLGISPWQNQEPKIVEN